MSQSVPSVSVAEIGLVSGIMGAGVGCVLAPRKYDLAELLTQKDDVFEKSISKTELLKQSETKRNSYQMIVEARKSILEASKINKGEAKFAELSKASYLESAYRNIKEFIPKARKQYALGVGLIAAFAGIVAHYISKPSN